MTARILAVGTALPATRLRQSALRDLFAGQPDVDRITARRIAAAFDGAAIEHRHTVLPELAEGGSPFIDARTRTIASPPTGARNAVFAREAPALFAEAAREAMDRAGVPADAVTHVITATCTGFFAPGPDYRLVRDLGLPPTVERDHLGFLGCAAALPALRSASRVCAVDPAAVVLVVCGELCSIHLRTSADPDQIVSAAVFADGAAAAIVTGTAHPTDRVHGTSGAHRAHLLLDGFATALTTDGEEDMAWTIGDAGFEMTLSAQIPRIIGREVHDALDPLLRRAGPVDAWAVHPGGRSILDRFSSALALAPDALDDSRAVLRDCGNMSSATVLFVLRRMLDRAESAAPAGATGREDARVLAVAFSPGLTVESALMTLRPPSGLARGSAGAGDRSAHPAIA